VIASRAGALEARIGAFVAAMNPATRKLEFSSRHIRPSLAHRAKK
jgi:hypothetical protein